MSITCASVFLKQQYELTEVACEAVVALLMSPGVGAFLHRKCPLPEQLSGSSQDDLQKACGRCQADLLINPQRIYEATSFCRYYSRLLQRFVA